MKYILATIQIFLFQSLAFSQNKDYSFSYQIDSILLRDTTPFKYQTAAINYTLIGEYEKAFKMRAMEYPETRNADATNKDKELFSHYKEADAKKAILNEAGKTRIVIFNEAHHVPLHRTFVTALLNDLYKNGYHFIGIEALSNNDSLLHQRKYECVANSYYTREACFGNLIRKAISTGYTVFPYEQNNDDSTQMILGREQAQAQNIKMLMDRNPQAKFIIYCGYDHIVEDSMNNSMGLAMAGRLKRMTGIDPFTIEQTRLTQNIKPGSRFIQLIKSKKHLLFKDISGNYFNAASKPKNVDCNMFHPDTKYLKGRPEWIIQKGMKLKFLQDKIKIDYPVLVKIYLKTDSIPQAVPVDVIELITGEEPKASLIYKRKKQIAVISNPKGITQEIKIR